MKTLPRLTAMLTLVVFIIGTMSFLPHAVSKNKTAASKVSISITGTSSLHDWEMLSALGTCDAELVTGDNSSFSSIRNLSFTIPVKTLKSGHNLMDKNTYKALKTSEYPNIAFVLSKAKITHTEGNNYEVNCTGKLTIAGTTHETDLSATGKWNASDKSFLLSGTKKLKMTDYNVKPPTVMMGTIKTGDAIAINYNLTLRN